MDRRAFLVGAGSSAFLPLLVRSSLSQAVPSQTATVTVSAMDRPLFVPESFTGLSYELAQLSDPAFFSARNVKLVHLFRRLSPSGSLRLGGNTSEFCWFQVNPSAPEPKLHIPVGNLAQNWMPHRLFAITPEAIDRLDGFLRATGWRAIYGVNFGNSTPERASREAAYVAAKLGPRLDFFQIGNEPDFYHDANNGTRPPGWSFTDYALEWVDFADAITKRVEDARFGGPDVGSSDWIARFADEVAPKLGDRLVALTGHYYAEGPPDSPRVTTARLLAGNPAVATSTEAIVKIADAHHLSYRMTEGNSCYRGGKPGMSDAFAAALWGADYMLMLACLGCAGVDLHGGDSRFLSAGLGDHNPGAGVEERQPAAPNGFYTPIESEKGRTPAPRPLFYGMLLAQQFAGTRVMKVHLQAATNVTAYAGRDRAGLKVALFNKDAAQPVTIAVQRRNAFEKGSLWRMQAPALNATSDVTLGGSAVGDDGKWTPRAEPLPVERGSVRVTLPAASAALLFIH